MRVDFVTIGGMGHRAGAYVYRRALEAIKALSDNEFASSLLIQPAGMPPRSQPSALLSGLLVEVLDFAATLDPRVIIVACNSAVSHLKALPVVPSAYLSIPEAAASIDAEAVRQTGWYFMGRSFTAANSDALLPGLPPAIPIPQRIQRQIDLAIDLVKAGEIGKARMAVAAANMELATGPKKILACSELSLLHGETQVFGSNVLDTMDVLVESAVARLLPDEA